MAFHWRSGTRDGEKRSSRWSFNHMPVLRLVGIAGLASLLVKWIVVRYYCGRQRKAHTAISCAQTAQRGLLKRARIGNVP